MRIYNCDTETTLQSVELYITSDELKDLESLLLTSLELNKDEFFDSGNLFGQEDGFDVIPPYAEFAVYSNKYIENMDSKAKRIIFTDR